MPIKHPDYPDIEFKPAIARYDWDQTYDVLEFVYLPQGFDRLMDWCGIPAFELMAIDRFTPYSYHWAKNYSDYVYNFLKQFNFSPDSGILERFLKNEDDLVLDIPVLNPGKRKRSGEIVLSNKPQNWDSTLEYWKNDPCQYSGKVWISTTDNNLGNEPPTNWRDATITVPAFQFLGNKYSSTAEYKIQLTEGNYKLTGLIYQGWQEGLIGSIPTVNQTFYTFTLKQATDFELNHIINNWCRDDLGSSSWFCANSLVLSKQVNGAWQQQSVITPYKFLFYIDIATYFTEVSTALMQYFTDTWNTYKNYQTMYASAFWYDPSYLMTVDIEVVNHILPYNVLPPQYHVATIEADIVSASKNSGQLPFVHNRSLAAVYPNPIEFTVGQYSSLFKDLCVLRKANNNKWNSFVTQDLGDKPIAPIDFNNGKLNRWIATPDDYFDELWKSNAWYKNYSFYAVPRGTFDKEYSNVYSLVGAGVTFFAPQIGNMGQWRRIGYVIGMANKKNTISTVLLANFVYPFGFSFGEMTLIMGQDWTTQTTKMQTILGNDTLVDWEYGINPSDAIRTSSSGKLKCQKQLRTTIPVIDDIYTLDYLLQLKEQYEEDSKRW